MKKIRITIGALTRVEYSVVVEVPDDLDLGGLDALSDDLYEQTDGGDYYNDEHYWEKGECHTDLLESDESATVTHELVDGKFVVLPEKEEVGPVLPVIFPPVVEPPFRLEDELDGEARNPGHF